MSVSGESGLKHSWTVDMLWDYEYLSDCGRITYFLMSAITQTNVYISPIAGENNAVLKRMGGNNTFLCCDGYILLSGRENNQPAS